MGLFDRCFGEVADPRADNARHDLVEVVLIAVAAAVCGAESCVDMAEFGLAKEPLFRQVLRLEHGIPSHDTFSRLFSLLDPAAFHTAFQRFMAEFAQAVAVDEVVALDGKAARCSFDRARAASPLHLVSARACGARLVLGQRAVADGGNGIDALLELLAMLDLKGRIVTADAMHCQRRTAEAVRAGQADYVLALKANQPTLLADVRLLLDDPQAPSDSWAETVDGDHGRIEARRASVLADIDHLRREHGFPGLAAIEGRGDPRDQWTDQHSHPLLRVVETIPGRPRVAGRAGALEHREQPARAQLRWAFLRRIAARWCSTSSWTRTTRATAGITGQRTWPF